jgi:hypothetical protein
MSTLCANRWLAIKRKPELCCAETVNVGSSLWKATENPTTIFLRCQLGLEANNGYVERQRMR